MKPYRTLVFAKLVQESALTVGGNTPHELVDLPLARDGAGRPTLRGSTLAGTFIATARAIAGSLPRAITSALDERDLTASAWRFAHAHPLDTTSTTFHQHVSIDPRTGAARDDHLFTLEALPPGTCWNFELEIAPSRETPFARLEALAAAVLGEWTTPGGAHLGRGHRHGYGWCHLAEPLIVRLTAEHAHLWPDAFAADLPAAHWIARLRAAGAPVLTLAQWRDSLSPELAELGGRRHLAELTGRIQVGERPDGYGLDTLSLGGHARLYLQAPELFPRVIAPAEIPFPAEAFVPDFIISALPDPQGRLCPHVPGASIRGVWRAALERHYRATGKDAAILHTLFGSTEDAGRLALSDATLLDDDWKLLWQQHVAIDEFSGGVAGSAKFDRLGLARGTFTWRARLEADSPHEIDRLLDPLRTLLTALGEGHLPLGGGIWRGHGHVRWQLDACRIRRLGAPAGSLP